MSPVPRPASSRRKHSTRKSRRRRTRLEVLRTALRPYVRELDEILNDDDFPGQHTLPVIAAQAAVGRLARRLSLDDE